MVKITKGGKTLFVSKGAFKEMYAPAGWRKCGKAPVMPPMEPAEPPVEPEGGNNPGEGEEPSDGAGNGLSEEETLENMTEVELKQYASLLGIKTKNLKGREELLQAIKAHKE